MTRFRSISSVFILGSVLSACQSPDAVLNEPSLIQYSDAIVLEEEPRRSANAEIADFDGDGLNDVVLAIGRHWPGPNLLLIGDGQGGFTRVDSLSNPQDRSYSLSAADMDGDGDLDLVVSNDRPDPTYVLLNNGAGGFDQRIDFGDGDWPTRNGTVADINNDGRPDVMVANRGEGEVGHNFVCLNETTEEFSISCERVSSGSTTTISVADMNRDGNPDLIIPFRDLGQSNILLGDGTGKFIEQIAFGPDDASYRAAVAVDLNVDGLLDLVSIDDQRRKTVAFFQLTDGGFGAETRIDDGEAIPYALDVADLDGNGRVDVLVGYRDAPDRLFFNEVLSLRSVSLGDSLGATYGFGIGDMNHDGVPDIAVARSDASDLLFLGTRVGND
ncbi:MAG: VCBS repeat-containing protein [Bacteroidetes bacterium]|nr:VCBS repeat-containing protein [Bacteroidota bacterium]MDA1332585.1 VCBS repeat-containing protein [Bacteroidota bacterium]